MKLPQFYIDDLIKTALQEDINYIDSTTDLLIPEDDISEAYYMAKDSGVLAGVEIAARVFKLLDENIEVKFLFKDGDRVEKGDILAEFKGNTAAMLKAENAQIWWREQTLPLPTPAKPSRDFAPCKNIRWW